MFIYTSTSYGMCHLIKKIFSLHGVKDKKAWWSGQTNLSETSEPFKRKVGLPLLDLHNSIHSSERQILMTVLHTCYSDGISGLISGKNNAIIGLETFISKLCCPFGYIIFHKQTKKQNQKILPNFFNFVPRTFILVEFKMMLCSHCGLLIKGL